MIDPIQFQPQTWDDVCGCDEIKGHYQDPIHGVRVKKDRSGWNTLITGYSRSGKTSLTRLAIRALMCEDFQAETLSHCGRCDVCLHPETYRVNAYAYDVHDRIRSHRVDCANLRPDELEEILCYTRSFYTTSCTVVYLDEIHHLSKGLDQKLLGPLEEHQAIWIGTSAYIEKDDRPDRVRSLDQMVLNRFPYKLRTTLPSVEELYGWLYDRCVEGQIQVDDPEPTLTRLAERCGQIPGRGLQVLSKAYKAREKLVTIGMVEKHLFDFD